MQSTADTSNGKKINKLQRTELVFNIYLIIHWSYFFSHLTINGDHILHVPSSKSPITTEGDVYASMHHDAEFRAKKGSIGNIY